MIAFVQLGHHHFDVLLPRTRQEKLLGLRVARKTQRQVFFEDLVDGHADAVFVRACLRLNRKGDGGLGNMRGLVKQWRRFVAQRFAGDGLLELGDRADVSGMHFRHFHAGLALHHLDVLEPFGGRAVEIHERGVVLQNAAHHLEVADAPRERVGQRPEDEDRKRRGIGHLALGHVPFSGGLLMAAGLARSRMGKNVHDEIQQAGAADILQRGSAQYRKDALGLDGYAQSGNQVFHRQRALLEKLFHQFVVALGDHLHQLLVRFLRGVSQIGGDLLDGGLAVAAGLIHVRFHPD